MKNSNLYPERKYLDSDSLSTIPKPGIIRHLQTDSSSFNTLAMSLEPQSQQHRRYTRIRIQDEDDFKRLYPLILDYIREPELASCAKEFVFRSHLPWHESYLSKSERREVLRAEENARDISQEHSIAQLVTDLGLEESEKPDWIRILTWMKPELVAAREQVLDNSESSWTIEPFYRHRNKLFSHYAAALLLMLCPNIEILKYEEGSEIVENILRRNNYGLLPATHLKKLRDVTLIPTSQMVIGDKRFYTNLDILALLRLFHRLPAIESVSTDAVGPNLDGGYVDHFPPATSNLKRIHIGHSAHGTDVIGPLIRVPKRLEEFTLSTGGRCIQDGQVDRCAETIGKALHGHRSSLRKIDIDIDEYIGGHEGHEDEDEYEEGEEEESKDEWYYRDMEISTGPLTTAQMQKTREYGATIGSMHDFESLTHLSIGIGLLLGGCSWGVKEHEEAPFRLADALPKSLEYLLIRGYVRGKVARYDDQIDEFLRLRQDRLPSLRELHGIDETIPIGLSIKSPDDNYDQLWQPKISDEDWVEALS
ncbi:hypothetical protein F4859DRAFT_514204 [Xylaria cf. heliscus]|nr:hypothetical protein F4859DRAFT_514204 [Xylaria cf. heliscus]